MSNSAEVQDVPGGPKVMGTVSVGNFSETWWMTLPCGAESPGSWFCCLFRGHEGPHVAHGGVGAKVFAEWDKNGGFEMDYSHSQDEEFKIRPIPPETE